MKNARPTLRLSAMLVSAMVAVIALAGDQPLRDDGDLVVNDADCQVGNLNDPVENVPGIFLGNESYAYFIEPTATCGCNTPDFELLSVTQLLYFDEQQVPVTFTVEATLLGAVRGVDCTFVPGPARCDPTPITYTIDQPGLFAVNVPTPGCGDFQLDKEYFLSLKYTGGGPASLAVDDEPAVCVEFIDYGEGWLDLSTFKVGVDKTGGGKAIVFGDIVCKEDGVAIETTTWGAVKGLYR